MKRVLFALFIFISISAYAQTYSDAYYLDAYYVTLHDSRGNINSNDVNITFRLTEDKLIMVGGITFKFYGGTSLSQDGIFSSMAKPNNGSGNCRVEIQKTGFHMTTIKISWANLVAVYECRDY